ncbi:AAA+-type ATPase [Gnomoniopsis smithogilvyi]|uniref:AAA+-type ATPase n=1 Tax=Gnomoniopsis smithogilvyi TaxID=1191159 RepID=A0A9W8YSG8_9PEZI|nr:AAA+-type ATPase [Gnomoniopsis smithogilvyi]
MKSLEFKVRGIPNASSDKSTDKSLKGASRIYVNKEVLFELAGTALENGKPCLVEKTSNDGQVTKREASLWLAAEPKLSRHVALMSKPFQDACGFKLEDRVKITYTDGKTTPEAEHVMLEDATADHPSIKDEDQPFWEWMIKGHLMGLDDVFPGLMIKRILAHQVYRTFKITSVNGSGTTNARFSPDSTKIQIGLANNGSAEGSESKGSPARPTRLQVDPIPGLEHQIQELNKLLRTWSGPLRSAAMPKSCGLAIHGGHGTGKTLLLNHICKTDWGTIHRISPNDKLQSINDILQKARDNQPSIIIMDRFEQLIYSEKERSNRTSVIRDVGEFLDKLAADATVKNERPKVVVIAACLDYMDMPQDLKETGRFKKHIHLPLPDETRRRAILSACDMPLPPGSRDDILKRLSERTHAYNGKDLVDLAGEATELWSAKLDRLEDAGEQITAEDEYLSEHIILEALQRVRPSAMHDVNLKPPPVHWDDIGGQDEVKKSLQEAIALATIPKDKLLRYTPNPPNGFLLYGPPGCSKTMAAQALATEADLNFFAVKGAELLNMYVGESERQIRQLFQRARDAAPSIIFFDEIDSIGGQRSGFGGSSSASSGGSGLNVLTTLLNEMQGFEQTQGVLVLAATNRPQALDPALLRPGRFDKLIYVKPPDEAARAAIFRKFVTVRNAAPDVDPEALASQTDGFSGAEIAKICSGAGLEALRRDSLEEGGQVMGITMEDMVNEIGKTGRMITLDMLAAYEAWARSFLKGATITLPIR